MDTKIKIREWKTTGIIDTEQAEKMTAMYEKNQILEKIAKPYYITSWTIILLCLVCYQFLVIAKNIWGIILPEIAHKIAFSAVTVLLFSTGVIYQYKHKKDVNRRIHFIFFTALFFLGLTIFIIADATFAGFFHDLTTQYNSYTGINDHFLILIWQAAVLFFAIKYRKKPYIALFIINTVIWILMFIIPRYLPQLPIF